MVYMGGPKLLWLSYGIDCHCNWWKGDNKILQQVSGICLFSILFLFLEIWLTQAGHKLRMYLELLILLPPHFESWDYRCVLTHLLCVVLGWNPRLFACQASPPPTMLYSSPAAVICFSNFCLIASEESDGFDHRGEAPFVLACYRRPHVNIKRRQKKS